MVTVAVDHGVMTSVPPCVDCGAPTRPSPTRPSIRCETCKVAARRRWRRTYTVTKQAAYRKRTGYRARPNPTPRKTTPGSCVDCSTDIPRIPGVRLPTRCPDHRRTAFEINRRVQQLSYRARKRDAWVEIVRPEVVFERDEYVCGICALPVDRSLTWPDPMVASVDHVVPLSGGGKQRYSNVQCAHMDCNRRKNNRPDESTSSKRKGV